MPEKTASPVAAWRLRRAPFIPTDTWCAPGNLMLRFDIAIIAISPPQGVN